MTSDNLLSSVEKREVFSELAKKYPILNAEKNNINDILLWVDDLYLGGSFFGKLDKKGNLIKILTPESHQLPDNKGSLFDLLFGGLIHHLAESSEYNNFITFRSNNSPAITVYYQPFEPPDHGEFYVAPRIIERAYKILPENKVIEIPRPKCFDGDMEVFGWVNEKFKFRP